ncbi:MAG TPA: DUF397 domain-containing protein [Pseudonocardiaceae bacterium]|nr:DUF397 domain-containing protein [Pseudonocardiaceae bacterium]
MDDVDIMTTGARLSNLSWRKSRRSGALGNCVELAPLANGDFAVRHSRQPDGPVLIYGRTELVMFLSWAKDNDSGTKGGSS